MSDLISRQAAIDALEKSRFPGAPYVDTGIQIALREIKALPSAQPEQRWIPCAERLPEEDMLRTLTTIRTPHKGTNVRSGHFYKGFFFNDNGDTWNVTDKEVLAWMPLPEPYQEGEQDE